MGNMCSRGGAGGPSGMQHSAMLSNPQAYFDALYGSSDGPNPSPYHPLANKPVRVPTLFELALEQLCVSLVDQQSLEGVLAQQQRKRRSSLQPYSDGSQEIDEAEGRSGAQTPTTPLAAAVWATTPLHRGAAGATRRYSHADALQHSHQAHQPHNNHHSASSGKSKHGFKSPAGHPLSPFSSPHALPFLLPPTSPSSLAIPHFAASTSGVMMTATGTGTVTPPKPPVKRARSMSLSSKESPELAPQSFAPGSASSAPASQRMLLAATLSPSNTSNGSSGNSSMMGRSFSSVGSSPLQQSFASSMASAAVGVGAARSMPASPFMIGASSSTSSPNNHNFSSSSSSAQYQFPSQHPLPSAGFPPLHRAFSDPYNRHATGSSYSVPAPPQQSWMEPPELHLGPASSSSLTLGGGGAAASGGAHFVSATEAAEDVMDGRRLSTSTLLSAGSMTLGVGNSVAFVGGQPSLLHQRQLRLPDSIVQLIFDRLISEELLTVHNIHLFTSSHLSHIDFSGLPPGHRESTDINVANQCGKYGLEITDEWLAVLFESTVKHYARMQANWNAAQEERARAKAKLFAQSIPRATSTPASPIITGASSSNSSSKHLSPEVAASVTASASLLPPSRSTSSSTPVPVGSTPSPSIFQQLRQDESKDSATVPAAAVHPFECQPVLSASVTTSPKLLAQTSTPHHGSISHLNLERQLSAAKLNLGEHVGTGGSLPNSPPRETARAASCNSYSTPSPLAINKPRSLSSASGTSPPPASLSLLQALSNSHAAALAASSACSSPHSMPTVHNPLSVTSPSPSLALYQSAPPLTALNLSGCSLLTNRALMPLQLCLMLKVLNLNSCTQISDELLSCTLANKYFLEELQLKGLRSITNETLKVLTDKTRLKKLHLDCCSLTDEGLATLGALTNLESFSVGWCGKRVSERGLSWLAGCFRLQVVCVAFTAVGSLAFLASLRLLRELNIAGLKISDPVGLKNPALFPCLKSAFMQRTHLREIPPSVLHYHLQVLDLSFSSDVPPARLLHQFTLWNACKPPQLPVVAATSGAAAASSGAGGEADVATFFGSSFGSAASSSSTPPRDYDPQRLGSLLSSTLRGEAADFSSSSTSPESSPPINSSVLSAASAGSSLSTSPPAALAPGANPHSIQLRRLVLESCCVTNRIAVCIAEMTNLLELNVSDTDLTGDGLIALAPLVNLRILNISGCKISNASVGTIATHMTSLRELYMDCPSVTDQGLALLRGSPVLARNLERLDIFETHITDAGLDALGDFRRLRFLEACGGRITNAGLAKLSLRHPQLTSLNLSQNKGIDDQGIDVLRHLTKLVHVNLSGTGVTHRGLAFLQEIKPGGKSGAAGGGGPNGANYQDSTPRSGPVGAGSGVDSSLRNISLFGCDVKVTSAKLASLPAGVQLGIDAGIVSIE